MNRREQKKALTERQLRSALTEVRCALENIIYANYVLDLVAQRQKDDVRRGLERLQIELTAAIARHEAQATP